MASRMGKEKTRQQALTGLFNRRYMEETLNREICRAERNKTPLGIIMLDIDHFRRFNNTFGHDAGDTFLQQHIREEDVVCRYGGEEFTLIIPSSTLETTCRRAEELRHKV